MKDKEAMAMALEALEYIDDGANNQGAHIGISWRCVSTKAKPAIAALKERLADPMSDVKAALADQEFILHDEENEGGWTDWICPKPDSYLMKCCDCGLVHEMQTRVANYESRPSEDFVVSSDPDLQAQFRVRRHEVLEATLPAQPAQRMKEWVEFLKRQSDNGQHMNIPSSFGAGTCWELAIELEQFINTHPPQRTEQEPTPEIKYKMIVIDDLHPQGIPVEQWVNPPQRTEQNFCSRCGKRTKDLTHIHTCTPPKENT